MNKKYWIILIVIVGLVFNVWWILTGILYRNLPPEDFDSPWREFVYITTLTSLILIPVCAREKKWGFLLTTILGIIILAVEVYLIPAKFSEGQYGGMIYGLVQIPILIFAYKIYRSI